MLTVPGRAPGPQGKKSTEGLEGVETAATELRGVDAEGVGNSGTIVMMRGGSDSRPRNHRRRRVSWQETPPNTSSTRPDQRGRSLEAAGTIVPSQRQSAPSQRRSASAQQTPNARG